MITVNPLAASEISINDVVATEGIRADPRISRSRSAWPRPGPVTVDFATADGTATVADNDYASAIGTVTFAPGDTAELVTVQVNGDTTLFEPNETFFVNLSNATGNATITDAQGAWGGTIQDDLTPPGGSAVSNACANSVTANSPRSR